MKYNFKLNLINLKTFSTVNRKQELLTLMQVNEVQDLIFRRKLCKEPRKDARSVQQRILNWIEKNQVLNKKLWLLYDLPVKKHEIFDITSIQKIYTLNKEYYKTLFLVINHETYKIQQRLTRQNLPNNIVSLQNIFLESFSTVISAVDTILRAFSSITPGSDGIYVPTLQSLKQDYVNKKIKGTRYGMSSKSLKIRKNFPKKAEITSEVLGMLKEKLEKQLFDLRFSLLQKSNLKSLCKNYKAKAVRRILIPKSNGNTWFLGILTLRERVMQRIVYLSLIPIAEYQADALSFGFRPKRSAIQPIVFIFTRLVKSLVSKWNESAFSKKVSQQEYLRYKGRKSRFRRINIGNRKRRQKRYDYIYWIYTNSKFKIDSNFCFYKYTGYYKIINIDIAKCFDELRHNNILNTVPLTSKYSYLLNSWFDTHITGPSVENGKIVTEIPMKNVLQSSIIGSMFCNFVFDGLQDHMEQAVRKWVYRLTYKKINFPVKLFCLRYVDDIFIFGKFSWDQLKFLQSVLASFLTNRGLKIKNFINKIVMTFKPGISFKYLGFKFLFPYIKVSKLDRGKFTKQKFTHTTDSWKNMSRSNRSLPIIIIDPDRYARIKLILREQLSRKNTPLSIRTMIEKLNQILWGAMSYYLFTKTIRKQISPLNNFIHKKFYKYLLSKYSSKPKVYTYTKKNFIVKNNFTSSERKTLLVIKNIRLHSGKTII